MDIEHANVPSTDSPGELAADVEVNGFTGLTQSDSAGEKRAATLVVHAAERRNKIVLSRANSTKLEYVRVLQKEIALFRKKKAETAEIDLPRIGASTGKISVDG